MKRALLVAVALGVAAALPATAGAGQWRGVVVAKEKNRGTIVTASRSGVVRTIRLSSGFGKVHVGQRVAVRAERLADGTFRLQAIRHVGKASKARARVIVVRHQKRFGRIIVSAGGSVFALRSGSMRRLAHDGSDGFDPGDRIDARLSFDDDHFELDDADEIGHAGLLELEGIYLETVGATLKLAVVHRGAVSVTVPGGFALPPLAPGDELELLVSVGGDGFFTLVSFDDETADDDEADDDDQGVDLDDENDEVEVKGTFLGVVDGWVSVQPGNGGSVVACFLDGGGVPAGIAVNDVVDLECELVGARLVVHELEEEDEADDEEEGEDEGEDHHEADEDDDDGDHSGPGGSDDDDDDHEDHSGPGGDDD